VEELERIIEEVDIEEIEVTSEAVCTATKNQNKMLWTVIEPRSTPEEIEVVEEEVIRETSEEEVTHFTEIIITHSSKMSKELTTAIIIKMIRIDYFINNLCIV